MNASDFIEAARQWAKGAVRDPAEPVYRSAISRAYYGAFHICCDVVEHTLMVRGNNRLDGKHTKVPKILGVTGDDKLKYAGFLLEDLKNRRHEADYELRRGASAGREAAELAVENASEIRDLLASFTPTDRDLRIMQSRIEPQFENFLTGWSFTKRY